LNHVIELFSLLINLFFGQWAFSAGVLPRAAYLATDIGHATGKASRVREPGCSGELHGLVGDCTDWSGTASAELCGNGVEKYT
jgi:hypothetical protein